MNNREKIIQNTIINSLKRKYGITLADKQKMLDEQDYKCKFCSKDLKINKACIDHDHKTGKVRWILCNPCNRGLGYLHDDVNILRKAYQLMSNIHLI